jgi:hypothetical protein
VKARHLKLTIGALFAALALLAAGCGDDDGDEDASGPPLTREELIAQGDEICAEGDAELEAAFQEEFGDSQQEPSPEDQAEFLSTTVADNFDQQRQQLAELNPPEEDAEQYEAILDALDELTTQVREDPQSFIEASEQPEASRLAQEYGFNQCGS